MSGPAFKAGTLPKDETPDYPGPCTRVPAFTYVGAGLQAGPYRRARLQITQDHVRGSRLSRMSGPACKPDLTEGRDSRLLRTMYEGPAFHVCRGRLSSRTLPKDETPDYSGPCTRVPAFTYVGAGFQAGPYRRTRLQITQDHVRGSRLSRMSGPAFKPDPTEG